MTSKLCIYFAAGVRVSHILLVGTSIQMEIAEVVVSIAGDGLSVEIFNLATTIRCKGGACTIA